MSGNADEANGYVECRALPPKQREAADSRHIINYYSDVRRNDQLYRIMTGAFTVVAHCPELREPALAWINTLMAKTNGRRLRWMVDPDGRQLKPDIRWMECQLSSEAPFHYLTAYWRGTTKGFWP
jgi:hypothetical protein